MVFCWLQGNFRYKMSDNWRIQKKLKKLLTWYFGGCIMNVEINKETALQEEPKMCKMNLAVTTSLLSMLSAYYAECKEMIIANRDLVEEQELLKTVYRFDYVEKFDEVKTSVSACKQIVMEKTIAMKRTKKLFYVLFDNNILANNVYSLANKDVQNEKDLSICDLQTIMYNYITNKTIVKSLRK